AAGPGTFYGKAMTAGRIYTVGGNGFLSYSGDGAAATRAEVFSPMGIARDQAGNLVILDSANHVVRVAAESTGEFYGRAMAAGNIYTVAGNGLRGSSGDGGPATGAELNIPYRLAVDGAGNLVIAHYGGNRVRGEAAPGEFYGTAMAAGHIYTVAGHGVVGFDGDGGPAVRAALHRPYSVAVDGAGNLLIADNGNNRIRAVAARAGTFYGTAMTAGN